jgi:hypothetical protein
MKLSAQLYLASKLRMRGFIPELRIRLHAIDKVKVTLSLCAPYDCIWRSEALVPFTLNLVAVRLTSF